MLDRREFGELFYRVPYGDLILRKLKGTKQNKTKQNNREQRKPKAERSTNSKCVVFVYNNEFYLGPIVHGHISPEDERVAQDGSQHNLACMTGRQSRCPIDNVLKNKD
jgi:hypothetical protein